MSTVGRLGRTSAGFPRALFVASHTHSGPCPIMGKGYIVVYADPLDAEDRGRIEDAIWGEMPDAGSVVDMAGVAPEALAECPHAGMSPPLVDPTRAVWLELRVEPDADHLAHIKDIVEPTCRTTAVGHMHLGGNMPHVDIRVLDTLEPGIHEQLGIHIQMLDLVSEVEDAPADTGYNHTVYFNDPNVTAEAIREALMSIGVFLEPPQQ